MAHRVLSLDASTKTGWALFVDRELLKSGALPKVKVEDFNVNKDPQKSPKYPWNIMDAAEAMSRLMADLVAEHKPDYVVIENTNKGKNRNTQRLLEWIHYVWVRNMRHLPIVLKYMDTSEWRSLVGLWMTKEDTKRNREVKAGKTKDPETGKRRGKLNKKHLAVRMTNELYGKKLKLKDNDEADAILMGRAFLTLIA
jgi:hypothetical protein